jgi:GT2 family glycosyltransferase
VHYQTPGLLIDCLAALRCSEEVERLEVFVVDNASDRFDVAACEAALPGVRIEVNPENVGFARATNQALRRARGRYLLLLNPDAFVAPETIVRMRDYMDDHPDVGCASCRVELADGSLDLACRRLFPTPERAFYRMTLLSKLFPRSRRFGQYNLTYVDEWQETEIDTPCGAFMFVRAEAVRDAGLLDEDYFMYGEDMDWSFRFKSAGWRIVYTPISTVRHLKRASSRQNRATTIRWFYDAMRIFYRKHYQTRYPGWVTMAVLAALGARERLELASNAIGRRRGAAE